MKCLMEKHGHWKNGAFDDYKAKKGKQVIPRIKVRQEVIIKAINKCKTNKGSTECDTAFIIAKCLDDHVFAISKN